MTGYKLDDQVSSIIRSMFAGPFNNTVVLRSGDGVDNICLGEFGEVLSNCPGVASVQYRNGKQHAEGMQTGYMIYNGREFSRVKESELQVCLGQVIQFAYYQAAEDLGTLMVGFAGGINALNRREFHCGSLPTDAARALMKGIVHASRINPLRMKILFVDDYPNPDSEGRNHAEKTHNKEIIDYHKNGYEHVQCLGEAGIPPINVRTVNFSKYPVGDNNIILRADRPYAGHAYLSP